MPAIDFSRLEEIYRNTRFDAGAGNGSLLVATDRIAETLRWVNGDDDVAAEAGIAILEDAPRLAVGTEVRVSVTSPRLGIGILAASLENLLDAPRARLREPTHFFLLDDVISQDGVDAPPGLLQYRAVLRLVALFAEAASYLDETRSELIFIDDGKFTVPVQYDVADMGPVAIDKADDLVAMFADATHKDQKLEILGQAIITISRSQAPARRFAYLLANLAEISAAVRDGYRLFASNFSYARIRSDLEAAKLEFVTKIHKTVVDIQGQLLGIPVATVIVASQLKVATSCSTELWTDVATLGGAWIFLVLLLIAIVNQWLTLDAIKQEIDRQQVKMAGDYAAISGRFADIFASLGSRIWWHRAGLLLIVAIAVAGAIFATIAFNRLVRAEVSNCISGASPLVVANTQ